MIYIVILNWNGASDTIMCLDSLLELNSNKFKIVICDNGSTDGSLEKIESWYREKTHSSRLNLPFLKMNVVESESSILQKNESGIYLIDIGRNIGYAAGNNVGINFSLIQGDMEYVWLLNNDTEVHPESLSELVHAFTSQSEIGICGSRLVYFSDRGKLQGLGGVFNPVFCSSVHYKANEDATLLFDDEEVSNDIDYVIGASMLISRNVLLEVGNLCEDYFLYYEEIDFCLRAKNKGFRVYCATKSIVYHKEGASTKKNRKGVLADYYWVRNRLLIAKKFYPKWYFTVYLSLFMTLANRLRRGDFIKFKNVIKIILGIKVTF